MTFRCPTCKNPLPDRKGKDKKAQNARKFFPFCCERCKLVDMGAWLDADYRIPVINADEEAED
ncbi:DNA gyrase inhibitor YacG [Anaerohalosphaera lusitana]|uniref:DNA gyrase inhibitor YacG n=1 Tax=Anaerohalosphaera lusitana TaxID=1936003 RepID=A0A1U9NPT3_9BACT|nr:DNA gyrase inhibitor YacG [Anaerohalosphaera lusitana]AQT69728.1 DNA gyrase inhibitor YacG [Anaerohalosphaera lusitana]